MKKKWKNIFDEKLKKKNKKIEMKNSEIFFQYNFHLKCSKIIFFKNSKIFFIEKNKYFFEVEKKNGYSFDAEKSYLSIGGVFRAIRANTKTLESTSGLFHLYDPPFRAKSGQNKGGVI